MPCADVDHRAPLGEARAVLVIFRQPVGQPVEAVGDDFARADRQRLGALVDLDAGDRAGLLDQLDQRRAVLGLLPDGLVVEDDAGDVVRSSPRSSGTAFRDSRGGCPRSTSTPMASKRFLMVPDDSSAARMPLPGATMAGRLCSVLRDSSLPPPEHYVLRAKIDGSRAKPKKTPGKRAPRGEGLPESRSRDFRVELALGVALGHFGSVSTA